MNNVTNVIDNIKLFYRQWVLKGFKRYKIMKKIQHYQNITITPRGCCASTIKNRYCIIMNSVNKLGFFLHLNLTQLKHNTTSHSYCYQMHSVISTKKEMYSLVNRFRTK